jgi:hypothetical protein
MDLPTSELTVGDGTPDSCTSAGIQEGLDQGKGIVFDCGPGNVTIPVTTTLTVAMDTQVSLDGGGRITLDGRGEVPILAVERGVKMLIRDVRFINGFGDAADGHGSGAALHFSGVKAKTPIIQVFDSVFEDNRIHGSGSEARAEGGGAIGGSHADVLIVRSTLRRNQCTGNCFGGGAFFHLLGNTRVYDSVFEDNTSESDFGGAVYLENGPCCPQWWFDGSGSLWCGTQFLRNHGEGRGGAISIFITRTTIENCHFEDNTSSTFGGALSLSVSRGEVGGEPTEGLGSTHIRRSSFVNNSGAKGAAIWYVGAEDIILENSTFTGHNREGDAVIFVANAGERVVASYLTIADNSKPAFGRNSEGIVNLSNSLLVGNGDGRDFVTCSNTLELDNDECHSGATNADPRLGGLVAEPGRAYFPLLGDSPAIGQGTDCPQVDQLGTARDRSCDLGAIEQL